MARKAEFDRCKWWEKCTKRRLISPKVVYATDDLNRVISGI